MDAAMLEREMVPVRLFLIWLPEGKKADFPVVQNQQKLFL